MAKTKRKSGMLAGLDINTPPPSTSTRSTRTAQPLYKGHPMDLVTRPNSAAVRERFKSEPRVDQESEDLSSGDDDEVQVAPKKRAVYTPQPRDAKAVRSSKRSEAQKPKLYSAKYHPQDYALPGHRSNAIFIPDDDENSRPSSQRSRKRKASPEERDDNDGNDDDDDNTGGVDLPATPIPRQPRKKLKSLGHKEATPKNLAKPAKRKETKKHAHAHAVDDLVEMAVQSATRPTPGSSHMLYGPLEIAESLSKATGRGLQGTPARQTIVLNSDESLKEVLRAAAVGDNENIYAANADDAFQADDGSSETFAAETNSVTSKPAASVESLDRATQVPEYIKGRIAAEQGADAPVTAEAIAKVVLDEFRQDPAAELNILKPYVNIAAARMGLSQVNQATGVADAENNSLVDEDLDDDGTPDDALDSDEQEDVDEEKDSTLTSFTSINRSEKADSAIVSFALDEGHDKDDGDEYEDEENIQTPPSNEFEEQFAIITSSRQRSSQKIASFDPVHGLPDIESDGNEESADGYRPPEALSPVDSVIVGFDGQTTRL